MDFRSSEEEFVNVESRFVNPSFQPIVLNSPQRPELTDRHLSTYSQYSGFAGDAWREKMAEIAANINMHPLKSHASEKNYSELHMKDIELTERAAISHQPFCEAKEFCMDSPEAQRPSAEFGSRPRDLLMDSFENFINGKNLFDYSMNNIFEESPTGNKSKESGIGGFSNAIIPVMCPSDKRKDSLRLERRDPNFSPKDEGIGEASPSKEITFEANAAAVGFRPSMTTEEDNQDPRSILKTFRSVLTTVPGSGAVVDRSQNVFLKKKNIEATNSQDHFANSNTVGVATKKGQFHTPRVINCLKGIFVESNNRLNSSGLERSESLGDQAFKSKEISAMAEREVPSPKISTSIKRDRFSSQTSNKLSERPNHHYGTNPMVHSDHYDTSSVNLPRTVKSSIRVFPDGSIYTGEMSDIGQKHGKGKIVLGDNSVYDGDWRHNMMCGLGKLLYPDGSIAYDGGFLDNKIHGHGVMYNAETSISLVSTTGIDYNNFATVGNSWVTFEGIFVNGKKEGVGKWCFSTGEEYMGNFSDDKVSGVGRFFSAGQIIFGVWYNNSLIKRLS